MLLGKCVCVCVLPETLASCREACRTTSSWIIFMHFENFGGRISTALKMLLESAPVAEGGRETPHLLNAYFDVKLLDGRNCTVGGCGNKS